MFLAPAPDAAWYVMALTHSTSPALKSPAIAMSMRLTVQLPPMKSLMPLSSAASMTSRLTGSSTITARSFIRSVEAASIQCPVQPAARRRG